MDKMFYYNQSLSRIYVGSGWNTANVTSSTQMFYASTLLPNYNSSVVDKTNAHTSTGGYLSVPSHTGGSNDWLRDLGLFFFCISFMYDIIIKGELYEL